MTFSREAKCLFGFSMDSEDQEKGVVPVYLEYKYKQIGSIQSLREKDECSAYEMAGLLKCLSSSDEEEVRAIALKAICEKSSVVEIKKLAIIISSFDLSEDVLIAMLEQANALDLSFAKEIASRFVGHEDFSVSEYAKGILSL